MLAWFERHKIIPLIITILIAIFIFYMSSLTFAAGAPGPEFKLKPILYHFLIFFLLSLFLLMATLKVNKKEVFLLALLISIIYAITDEFHQLFVPGRTCSLSDILTDSAGILFAGLLYSFRMKSLQK